MLKAILAVIVAGVIAIASAGLAHAQSFAEVQTKVTTPHGGLLAMINLSRPLYGSWGLNAFFLTTSGWGEAYTGPTLSFDDGRMAINLSAGGEQGGMEGFQPRYSAFLWTERGRLSFLGIVEANNGVFRGNDSGLWYEITGKAKILPWLYAGFKDKRPSGMGPYLQVKLPEKVAVWATWHLWGSEDLHWQPSKVLLGVRVGF